MTLRCRWLGALTALGFVLAGCGESSEPDRLELKTPRVQSNAPTPSATPSATPDAPDAGPVTAAEKRVIRGWSDELRHGDVDAASKYFSVPSRVSNLQPDLQTLETEGQVRAFNASLPCGAKLISTRRSVDGFVVGVFELTERPGGDCGTGTGARAAVAFLIDDDHIAGWIRADEADEDEAPDGDLSSA